MAQVTAISQSVLRQMPPGINPPFILSYNASTVPVLQLALSGQKLSEQQLYDLGTNFLRTQLATVQGASIALPYGGKQPQIVRSTSIPSALQAQGPGADRRGERDRRTEPDPARRHGEDRRRSSTTSTSTAARGRSTS